jgi:pimeloyl-ACP methyl ester carboxylesterase
MGEAGADAGILAQQAFDHRDRLPEIEAHTLVIVGADDALVSIDDARLLADTIPRAELQIMERAGHLINVENPEVSWARSAHTLADQATVGQ